MQRNRNLLLSILSVVVALTAQVCVAQQPLAPGVLKTIPVNLDPRDSFSLPMPLPGLKTSEWQPNYIAQKDTLHGMSQRVILFRDVWQYEISIVGQLRQAKLLVPDKTGASTTKNVWYLLYRIRDTGKTLTYEQVKLNPEFEHIKHDLKRDQTIASDKKFFLPRFQLEGWVLSDPKMGYQKAIYADKVSPMVARQIQRREDASLNLLDPIALKNTTIPVAKSDSDGGVWGVAVFEDVDPRIDFVSVYVGGLTNAFRIQSDPDLPTLKKTLQLNFWRPGDTVDEEDDDIKFGIPLVDDPQKQVLIASRYDLPGPLIRVYRINKEAGDRQVLVLEANAQVNLKDFTSAITPVLDQGNLPPSISKAFADSAISIDNQPAIETLVPGKRWTFKQGEDKYILAYEPLFWERDNDGIRFIKSLDYLWIYR